MFDLSTLSVLLQSIVVAVVIVLAVFAWRWLRVALERGQLAAQNEALAQLAIYARIFVDAAEQTLTKSPGFSKLDWVLAQFDTVLPDVDKQLVRSFVEAAVKSLPPKPAPKTLTLAAPPPNIDPKFLVPVETATSGYVTTSTPGTGPYVTTSTTPPAAAPVNCDTLAPPAPSHSHKDRRKPKAAQTV